MYTGSVTAGPAVCGSGCTNQKKIVVMFLRKISAGLFDACFENNLIHLKKVNVKITRHRGIESTRGIFSPLMTTYVGVAENSYFG